jgi:hypothetical protein
MSSSHLPVEIADLEIGDVEIGGLPLETGELILSKLSFADFARVSTTCRAWDAFLGRRRCDLAVSIFGQERIGAIAEFLRSFLNGEIVGDGPLGICGKSFIITAEGELQDEQHTSSIGSQYPYQPGAFHVYVQLDRRMPPTSMCVWVPSPNQSLVRLIIDRGLKEADFCVKQGDVPGLALIQALLTWGFSPSFRDVWPHSVTIKASHGSDRFSQARLDAQIAPLRPLVSKHANWAVSGWEPQ